MISPGLKETSDKFKQMTEGRDPVDILNVLIELAAEVVARISLYRGNDDIFEAACSKLKEDYIYFFDIFRAEIETVSH